MFLWRKLVIVLIKLTPWFCIGFGLYLVIAYLSAFGLNLSGFPEFVRSEVREKWPVALLIVLVISLILYAILDEVQDID